MVLPEDWATWMQSSLDDLEDRRLLRTLHPLVPTGDAIQVVVPGPVLARWVAEAGLALPAAATEGLPVRLFSSNDYLGLSAHPAVAAAAAHAARLCGMGTRASPLVGGHMHTHAELEVELARLKGAEACLLFPTGFAANLGAVAALAGPGTAVFSDELNHASIVDGARLAARSGAAVHVFRHRDMRHLEELLRAAPHAQRKLVVSDSLFSMDGDFADLACLARLKAIYGFLLALDEAHATLVCGATGGGWAEASGAGAAVDVHMGTLSKAAGCLGGFVAGSKRLVALLASRARPGVFSTALPAPVAAAALAALRVAQQEPQRRAHLWRLVARLGAGVGVAAASPIVPLVVGGEAAALRASAQLLLAGFYVPAIRPPTVPPGTCRRGHAPALAVACFFPTRQRA